MVELDKVVLVSSRLYFPREGFMCQFYHMLSYLKKQHDTQMVLNPSDYMVQKNTFEIKDWASSEVYHLIKMRRGIPLNMP